MEDNVTNYIAEQSPAMVKPKPSKALMLLLACVAGGFVIVNIITLIIGMMNGWDLTQGLPPLTENSGPGDRNQYRVLLLLSHLFLFVAPAIIAGWILFKHNIYKELQLDNKPQISNLGLGVILLLCAMPLVQYTFWLNQQIPLPEWMINTEESTNSMLQNLLITESPYELLFNLLIVAIVPAIGEELVFRGLVQRSFQRITNNPHWGIWIAAFIFSFIHFQFQGFIPRMLLGAMLGYLFYWTGNLWVPIIAHFFNNASQLIAQHLFYKDISGFDLDSIESVPISAAIVSIVLIVGLSYFIIKNNKPGISDELS